MRDLEAERRTLSGMIHDETACINAIVQLTAGDFSEPFHQDLFGLIESVYTRGTRPDYVKLLREGMKLGVFEAARDADNLKYVSEHYIEGRDSQYFIDAVLAASKTRQLSRVVQRYAAMVEDGLPDVDTTLAEIVRELSGIHAGNKDGYDTPGDMGETLKKIVEEKEARYVIESATGSLVLEGLPTGFGKLDEYTLGYKPGDLIILAAQTGHGKSAFSLQTAKNIAIDIKRPVLYVNTEMSREMVVQRLASNIADVPFMFVRQGNFTGGNGQDRQRIMQAVKSLKQGKLIHRFAPNLTPSRCLVIARQAKVQYGIEMLIIDYIGRMEKAQPGQAEWQVLEQISKEMKILAQELQIPVLILAQLNEDGSLQGAKRIKNECDLLLKLVPMTEDERKQSLEKFFDANHRLYLDKNRDGQAGIKVALNYNKVTQRIEQARPNGKYAEYEQLGKVVRQ